MNRFRKITPKYSVPVQLIVNEPFAEGRMAYKSVAKMARSLCFVNTQSKGNTLNAAKIFQIKFNFCVSSQLYGNCSSITPTYNI